ncbi:atp-Dependent DNA ligase [Arthrobacter sp. Hiyo1]|uniref:hypothetical protein n=1 Tax=Arthrobacter sp. Hiyo1 TaxID=1588020 RepID=UPI0006A34B62|nr:hypothetical protein [Arthrobacter sp. Hiyo1]GAP61265.1 atp-Dependent DNA ligase [Arthrobacter sp. Hiyo1]
MIKGSEQAFEASRIWLKVKRRNNLDVVVAAVTGSIGRPSTVVVGLPMYGRLRIVGRSSVLSAAMSRNLGRYLRRPVGNHPWPEEIPATWLDRFSKDREPVRLTLVEPIVVEVSADVAWSDRAFRHSVRVLRARPDLDPADVTIPEKLEPPLP